jgi:2-iminoacetate synthase ThiH
MVEAKTSGFDDFISGTSGIDKKASDMGVKGKWPSASEMQDYVKKQGMGGDVTHTPLQVMDPAYLTH